MSHLDDLLRSSLQNAGAEYSPADQAAARERFMAARRRRKFYVAGEFALAGGMAALAILFLSHADLDSKDPTFTFTAGPPEVVAEIESDGEPVAVSVGEGSVWLTTGDGTSLSRLDPNTNARTGSLDLDAPADEVVAGNGSVWLSDTRGDIYEIDPLTTDVLNRFPSTLDSDIATHLDLALSSDGLWAVDPATDRLIWTDGSRYEELSMSTETTDVAAQGNDVWLYSPSTGQLRQVLVGEADRSAEGGQPPSGVLGQLGEPIEVPKGSISSDLAIGWGAAWIATGTEGQIHRVDLETGDVTTIDIVGEYADLTIGVDQHAVWALAIDPDRERSFLYQFDGTTTELVSEPLKLKGVAADISAGEGSLWVPNKSGKVLKIAPEGGPQETPAPDETKQAGFADNAILFAFARDGDIYLQYPGRADQITATDAIESDPVVSPDGKWLLFERLADETLIVTYDVVFGEECCVRPGTEPAIGPNNQIAWVVPFPISVNKDDPSAVQEIGFSILGSEKTLTFPAMEATSFIPGFTFSELSWDPTGRVLFVEGGYEGRAIFDAALDSGPDGNVEHMYPMIVVEPEDRDGGGIYLGLSSSDEFNVLHACCVMLDSDLPTQFEFGGLSTAAEQGFPFSKIADIEGIDPMGDVYTTFLGEVWVTESDDGWSFAAGDNDAWLVGDGQRTWIVNMAGEVVELELEGIADASAPNGLMDQG